MCGANYRPTELLEKQTKAQRKKERAQNTVIQESPEATAAFLAVTDASGSAPATDNNIEVSSIYGSFTFPNFTCFYFTDSPRQGTSQKWRPTTCSAERDQ
jgi:hypothetical protein